MSSISDYIGDGVYATYTGYSIELRANDIEHPTDTIVLEMDILDSLIRFRDRCIDFSNKNKTE